MHCICLGSSFGENILTSPYMAAILEDGHQIQLSNDTVRTDRQNNFVLF